MIAAVVAVLLLERWIVHGLWVVVLLIDEQCGQNERNGYEKRFNAAHWVTSGGLAAIAGVVASLALFLARRFL